MRSRARTVGVVALIGLMSGCASTGADESNTASSAVREPSSSMAHLDHGQVLEEPDVMGRPDRIIAGPQGGVGQFFVECEFSHSAPDDPILYPDQPGQSHVHAFFGNVSTDAFSRHATLVGQDTSCDDARDTAAYWVPVLVDGGQLIPPAFAIGYYRAGIDIDPTTVEPFPPGLVMIAGDPLAEADQPIEVVAWSCGHGSRKSVLPPQCPPETELRLSVTFPDCWDGVHLDVVGHRRHMHYSSGGHCPASHPIPVPQLVFAAHYPVSGDVSGLRLSSGTIRTGHADFMNSWDQSHLRSEVDLCIRRSIVCGVVSGRRPV